MTKRILIAVVASAIAVLIMNIVVINVKSMKHNFITKKEYIPSI